MGARGRAGARVQAGFRRLLGNADGDIALGQNTHELVTRLLSALPLRERPKLVTSDGEFHTIRRQLDRLAEEGLAIVKVAARPADTLADRFAPAVDYRTACVLVSSVLFETAEIVPDLGHVARACDQHGAALLVDAYHHLNVVPFDIRSLGLGGAYVTGGGYKYCQLGEGNAFLRVPPGCRLRPVLTGWFSEFAQLERPAARPSRTPTAPHGSRAPPTIRYRTIARLLYSRFHGEQELTPERLREISRRQVALLKDWFESLDMDPAIARIEPDARRSTRRVSRAAMRTRGRSLSRPRRPRRPHRFPRAVSAPRPGAVSERRSIARRHRRVSIRNVTADLSVPGPTHGSAPTRLRNRSASS